MRSDPFTRHKPLPAVQETLDPMGERDMEMSPQDYMPFLEDLSLGRSKEPEADTSEDEGDEYQHGGPVRRRRLRKRRPRMRRRRRGGPLHGSDESKYLRRWTGAPRTGYGMPKFAAGGSVGYGVSGPVMMSAALDSRSRNPDNAVEDAAPLATRPEGAPEVPEEMGYRRGGPVRKKKRRTGYQEGGEVEEYEDEGDYYEEPEPELPQELEEEAESEPEEEEGGSRLPPMEDERTTPSIELEEEMPSDPREGAEEEPEGAPEGEGAEEGPPPARGEGEEGEEGGGRTAPTGYNAPPTDQGDRDPQALREQEEAAEEPTGFQQAALRPADDPQQALRDVLDWTQKQFGLDRPEQQQPQTEQPQQQAGLEVPPLTGAMYPRDRGKVEADWMRGYGPSPAQAPQPTAPEEGRPPAPPEQQMPPQPQPAAPFPRTEQTPTPQPRPQTAPAAPPTAPQQLASYLKGERNFTPEQMTQLLDRSTQANPNLDQSGAIRKAFGDLVDRGDMDGASRFVQSLRPSYDNLRAAMVAAAGQGKFVEALQIAERMNNIIPNGNQVTFHPTENGLITAIVRPENGQAARTYHLTPQQFQDYAKGPASVFDIAANRGIDATMETASGMQNPENAPPYRVAGPMMPPPTGAPAAGEATPAPGAVPMPQPRPAEAGAGAAAAAGGPSREAVARETADLGLGRDRVAPLTGAETKVAQRPGDVITGGRGPYDRRGLSRAQREGAGHEDVRSGGFPLGGRSRDTSPKYGNRVFDEDGWPTGIPRGGQFTRDGRYYDVGGSTYDVDRQGLPLAQQGQPGWQPPARGQRGWTGTTEPFSPQMPTVGRDPITGRPSYNPSAIREGQQQQQAPDLSRDPRARYDFNTKQWTVPPEAQTGYRAGQQQAMPTPAGWGGTPAGAGRPDPTNPNITVYPARPQVAQQQPQTTTGQGQQPPTTAEQRQPTTQQQQQPRTYQERMEQYKRDLADYQLRDRAYRAFPYDEGKQQRYYDQLKRHEDLTGERTATQKRHDERIRLDQAKLDAANQRNRETQEQLNNRALMQRLTSIGMQRERLAFQELQDRVKAWEAKPENKIGNAQYPYEERDKQLLRKLRETAIENDMWEQQRPQLRQAPNAPPSKPVEPAVRESPRLAPAPDTTTTPPAKTNGATPPTVDLEKYRGDKEPYAAPKGKEWRRSKSTGEWKLFDASQ
jgi:hypothetical protein